jgi:hypothetical protein
MTTSCALSMPLNNIRLEMSGYVAILELSVPVSQCARG